ncbi:argininosuccinate synthase [Leuconostoc mesenteroides]|uniref:Argininosuccinate synthase n=1 Tax=Leuconostoc mesenteroides subsp. cremoris ATCC 19254 TaxID=586220 RepID=C2KJT1_LEUMC|nr:argininosuccinate synthase [Leuconostoc mesenteroides]EQC84950.1 argininosuccinate synthase [Leuconostoc mesenteroides subsp. cremoris TIFN8]KDA51110.1 Argininosuccinate synthase [Leuconostoc mesenteroides subsp. cremoris T26]EEJ42434.1 argininosuccinate synthase [Leuconostoc mesenteroides subsp. cremoris ATCC 19254]KDA52140.1 Argininosuccinate synthase [Leuconostoc mesenteroides subsp. cremoris T26]MDG9749452.1 argininosuccinate synthase [Leuconostoc mesenteroides]
MTDTLVLAYSGGLDTSVAIPWLKDKGYDVIAVVLDVGQHGKNLNEIQEKALKVGAKQSIVIDVKGEFADKYVAPVIKANMMYEGEYPMVSALSRPLIIKKLVDIAHENDAVAIAHGSTGHGNDQVRFEAAIHALDPDMKIEAPIRDFQWSREEEIQYAQEHDVPVPIDLDSPYSIDENLWGRANEAGILENPWNQAPEDAFALTTAIEDAPDTPEFIDVTFEAGVPVALNGEVLSLEKLIVAVNEIAGKHGIGRIDHIENRLVGIKSREIYEAPAAAVLMTAHKDLEDLTLERDVAHFKPIVEQQLANLVYEAKWVSPLFDSLMAFIDNTQQNVNGVVKMKLFKGNATAVARQSEHNSLYDEDLATYTSSSSFDQASAVGFIKLWTLSNTVYEQVNHVHSQAKKNTVK